MNIRIVQNNYSDGTLKYEVRQRNWRGGYDEVYKPNGSGVAEFDTFDEAFKFASQNKINTTHILQIAKYYMKTTQIQNFYKNIMIVTIKNFKNFPTKQ